MIFAYFLIKFLSNLFLINLYYLLVLNRNLWINLLSFILTFLAQVILFGLLFNTFSAHWVFWTFIAILTFTLAWIFFRNATQINWISSSFGKWWFLWSLYFDSFHRSWLVFPFWLCFQLFLSASDHCIFHSYLYNLLEG